MKYLYKNSKINSEVITSDNIEVGFFIPKIRNRLTASGEKVGVKSLMVRFLFRIITHGKMKIFYVRQNDEIIHTSYVVPKCSKFPFLGINDYEIGPCYTNPQSRGKGIYPLMIRYICNSIGNEDSIFYMIVDETNSSSIRGIEKAGFKKCGNVEVTGLFKRYKIIDCE